MLQQLAELTPADHPDHEETKQLCTLTEKIIRDMNCVKAREEDYQELKQLEGRIKGLPEGFHLASRQRHLFKQGILRSISLYETDRMVSSNPFDRAFANHSPTPSLVQVRPLGPTGNNSQSTRGVKSNLHHPVIDGIGSTSMPASASRVSHQSPILSHSPHPGNLADSRGNSSFYSAMSSGTVPSTAVDQKRSTTPQPQAPLRPASRKTSMANLFARTYSNNTQFQGEDETVMHTFVFDDILLLTIPDKEEEVEGQKTMGKQSRSKKKQGSQNIQASPTLSQMGEDNSKYTALQKIGLSRILGVTSRASKGSTGRLLEVEVLPLNMSGEGRLRGSVSTGSMIFLFSFAEEVGSKGATAGQELCSQWEKAMERSFLSCIQARKNQSRYAPPDLSSPIFGVVKGSGENVQSSHNTAQADWPRRRGQVTEVVMNAARCGDRTTLTALLQAGLPFPRSPSQQRLSDMANRTVAMVATNSFPPPVPEKYDVSTTSILPISTSMQKSPSQNQIQSSAIKKSPVLGYGWSRINVNEVARISDLGNATVATRTLSEERREEKTWWSLRLKEIELEGERTDLLEKLMGSRRSKMEALAETTSPTITTTLATRVRKGLPVLKPTGSEAREVR